MKDIVLGKDQIYFSLRETDLVLRVWKNDNKIYIRVDRFDQYSISLSKKYNYFASEELPIKIMDIVTDLMDIYLFPTSVEKEGEIISVLSKLKIVTRNKEW